MEATQPVTTIQEILREYSHEECNLISILQDVQGGFGYLSPPAVEDVAEHLKITRRLDEFTHRFHALFLGTGAGLPWFMNIPGENLNGVYSANEYLTRMNLMGGFKFPLSDTPVKNHKHVAVIGGGNVAMDCARTALRLGADAAYIVYRRSQKELPARFEEYENAGEEGVIFHLLTLPVKLIADEKGWLREMECLKMELGEPDASGRRRSMHQYLTSRTGEKI